jgi:hypothetical protein
MQKHKVKTVSSQNAPIKVLVDSVHEEYLSPLKVSTHSSTLSELVFCTVQDVAGTPLLERLQELLVCEVNKHSLHEAILRT